MLVHEWVGKADENDFKVDEGMMACKKRDIGAFQHKTTKHISI